MRKIILMVVLLVASLWGQNLSAAKAEGIVFLLENGKKTKAKDFSGWSYKTLKNLKRSQGSIRYPLVSGTKMNKNIFVFGPKNFLSIKKWKEEIRFEKAVSSIMGKLYVFSGTIISEDKEESIFRLTFESYTEVKKFIEEGCVSELEENSQLSEDCSDRLMSSLIIKIE